MSSLQHLRSPRCYSLDLDRKHEGQPFSEPHRAFGVCTDNNLASSNGNNAWVVSTIATPESAKESRDTHPLCNHKRRRGSFPLFEKRRHDARSLSIGHPVAGIIPFSPKRKRKLARPFCFFVKRNSLEGSRVPGSSLISVNSETGVGGILQQQLDKCAAKTSVDKQPQGPHTHAGEDYLTARGANPRTGVPSPDQGLSPSDISHDQTRLPQRRASIVQRWRQKGDQWISVDIKREPSLKQVTPAPKRKKGLRIRPSSGSSNTQSATASAMISCSEANASLSKQLSVCSSTIEGHAIAAGVQEDTTKSGKLIGGPPQRLVPSSMRTVSAGNRATEHCNHHWGDSAVASSMQHIGMLNYHPHLPRSPHHNRGCRVDIAPCQPGHVKTSRAPSSLSPEGKLSRVTELSESDNQTQRPIHASEDHLSQLSNKSATLVSGVRSMITNSPANVCQSGSATSTLTRPGIKRCNASRGSLPRVRPVARSKDASIHAKPHVIGHQIKRKPLSERPNSKAVVCPLMAGCTFPVVRQASRSRRGFKYASRWERKLSCRKAHVGATPDSLKLQSLHSSVADRNLDTTNCSSIDCVIGATDGTFERRKKPITSSKSRNMERPPPRERDSSSAEVHSSNHAGGTSCNVVEEEGLPMTAFLIATLVFVRDFILDRKTFRYLTLVFGYLLQMVSHTLCVSLLICNAFLICLRTASPRKSLAYLREMKHFSDDLYHALCYTLLLTLVFGAAWKVMDYALELIGLLIWLYQALRGMSYV